MGSRSNSTANWDSYEWIDKLPKLNWVITPQILEYKNKSFMEYIYTKTKFWMINYYECQLNNNEFKVTLKYYIENYFINIDRNKIEKDLLKETLNYSDDKYDKYYDNYTNMIIYKLLINIISKIINQSNFYTPNNFIPNILIQNKKKKIMRKLKNKIFLTNYTCLITNHTTTRKSHH